MKDRISEGMLRQRIGARIRELGESGIFMSGSFVRTVRKCGNPSCRCAQGGAKHPCCLLTSKVKGKTKAIYVPVDIQEEVSHWVEEYRKIRRLIKEIDRMGEQIVRQHVSSRRAAGKNLKLLSRSRRTS